MDGGVHSHGACRYTCDSLIIAKRACHWVNLKGNLERPPGSPRGAPRPRAGHDAGEGIDAFIGKREPVWLHK